MSKLFTLPQEVILTNAGALIPGAKAYFYEAGTATPQSVYTEYTLTTPHADPVVADGNGRFPTIYLDPTLDYKVKITDAADVEIYTQDYTSTAPDSLTQSEVAEALWPRTAAEIAANVTPSDYAYEPGDVRRYGAVGDGANDDTSALQDAISVYLSSITYVSNGGGGNVNGEQGACLNLKPAGRYRTTDTLWLGSDVVGGENFDDNVKNIQCEPGFIIECHASAKPALDMAGGYNYRISNLTIYGDGTNTPSLGMLLARSGTSSPNPSAGNHQFVNCKFVGNYTIACVYNYGSEINRWTTCEFRNAKASSTAAYYASSDNATAAITSANTTVDTSNYQSAYGDTFVNCNFRYDVEGTGTNALMVLESPSYGPKFYICYFDMLQGATTTMPYVRLNEASSGSTSQKRIQGVSFYGCVLENDFDSFVSVNADTRDLSIQDCQMGDGGDTAEIVVEAAGTLINPNIQSYQGSSTVTRVTYSVTGTLRNLENSEIWDPSNIPDGDEVSQQVSVLDADLGDFALASFSNDISDLSLTAAVTANDTVTVTLYNNTGAAVNLGSGTLRVKVIKAYDS